MGMLRNALAPMKRHALFLLLVAPLACLLSACGTFSTDPAPGGISATETGMNAATIRDWQDQTIRQLAY